MISIPPHSCIFPVLYRGARVFPAICSPPRCATAPRGGGGGEMAAALAGDHALAQARQVPARRAFLAEDPHRRRRGIARAPSRHAWKSPAIFARS